MRVKCTAMLLTVYLKSNEITFEVKRPQKLPALESREKKGRGSNSGEIHSDTHIYSIEMLNVFFM